MSCLMRFNLFYAKQGPGYSISSPADRVSLQADLDTFMN